MKHTYPSFENGRLIHKIEAERKKKVTLRKSFTPGREVPE